MIRLARLAQLGLVAGGLLLAGCGAAPGLRASGHVDADTVVVQAPAIAAPSVNPDAGLAVTSPTPRVASLLPVVRVASVTLTQGQRVKAGQLLLTLDASALDAALAAANADAGVASAQPGVLDQSLSDARDTRSDLVKKRSDLKAAIATMTTKRPSVVTAISTLTTKLTGLDATIAQLASKRAGASAAVDQLTAQRAAAAAAGAPTDALDAALAQAKAGLAQLDAALAQAKAGRTQLAAGLAKAKSGLAQLDAGLAKARSGLAQLNDGLATLDDGLTTLSNTRELAALAATASALAESRAKTSRDQATVTAPADGVLITIAQVGDTLAPGATLAVIRPDADLTVTTWLSPDEAAQACLGGPATVVTDWGTTFPAKVSRVGVQAQYPPTSTATEQVHPTRAVGVQLTLDASAQLPAGAGVDVIITPCQART